MNKKLYLPFEMGAVTMTRDGKCDVNPMRKKILSYEEVIQRKNAVQRFLKLKKVHMIGLYFGIFTIKNTVL